MTTKLKQFNQLSKESAVKQLYDFCASSNWAEQIASKRPYADIDQLIQQADLTWSMMQSSDYLEAFAGHPKIGDISTLDKKYATTAETASNEQSAVADASQSVIESLAELNQCYDEKFGFIFIVFASGKSASDMLSLLKQRIDNDRDTEIINAAEEQRKIMHLRLSKSIIQ